MGRPTRATATTIASFEAKVFSIGMVQLLVITLCMSSSISLHQIMGESSFVKHVEYDNSTCSKVNVTSSNTSTEEDKSNKSPIDDQVRTKTATAQPSTAASIPPLLLLACEWKPPPINLKQCNQLLTNHLLQGKHHWYFIGDSTMRYLFNALHYQLNETGKNDIIGGATITVNNHHPPPRPRVVKKAKNKCSALGYFGFKRAAKWTLPNKTLGEGPKTVHSPYCPEALSINVKMEIDYDNTNETTTITTTMSSSSSSSSTGHTVQFELVTVEYSLDVELPTLKTRTTQETVAMYLERENRNLLPNDTVCIVNTGIHDTKLQPYMTPQLYATNVERYLRLIHPHCGLLIWLGISTVSKIPDPRFPQSNEDLLLMEDAVKRMLDRYNRNMNKNSSMVTSVTTTPFTTNATSAKNGNRKNESTFFSITEGMGNDSFSSMMLSKSSRMAGQGMKDGSLSYYPIVRIDVWNKSLTSPHKDHVHLSPTHYYNPLGHLFAQFFRTPPLMTPSTRN